MTRSMILIIGLLIIFSISYTGCGVLDEIEDILDDDSVQRPLDNDDDDDNDDNDDNDEADPTTGFDPSDIIVEGNSESVGAPNNGWLENGVQLDETDEVHVINPSRAWGTVEIVRLLKIGAAAVAYAYPDTVPLVIGDISIEGGGTLSPHRTHQSGRDVDVGLYMLDNEYQPDWFPDMTENNTDIEKNWLFIKTLAETGIISHVLLDYDVQAIFYEALVDTVDEETLSAIFQYPRPKDETYWSLVWHVDSHQNHFHIEIMCPAGDDRCTEWE